MASHEESCVLEASLEGARARVESLRHIHKNPDRTLGGIALTLECLRDIQTRVDCSGPTLSQDGQKVCPLQKATYEERVLAFGPWPPAAYEVDLADAADPTVTHASDQDGQYL